MRRLLALIGAWLAGLAVLGISSSVAAQPVPSAVQRGDLLLFAVQFESTTLTEAMTAYGDPSDPLLPLGEMARMFELDVELQPAIGRATGRLGEKLSPLTIDLASGEGRSGATGVAIGPADAFVTPTEIYVRSSLMAKLLPISLRINEDNLLIAVEAREKLPVQARRERAERLLRLGAEVGDVPESLRITAPYRWISRPAFDFSVDLGNEAAGGGFTRRFESRFALDLLTTNVTGFLGTDGRGKPANMRIKAERQALDKPLFGPLRATRFAAGDIFAPGLTLGPRTLGGAGVMLSTAPREQLSVFERIDLRGELPQGYDVELYINDVLRAGQNTAVQGRYEFLDVPLVRGINVIRIVAFGPRGERDEQTRVINVGGGQVGAGRTVIEAGVVAQDRALIDLNHNDVPDLSGSLGKLRAVASVAHGISPTLTVQAGAALYHDHDGAVHRVASGGFRTSLAGLAVQMDYARDFRSGSAISAGIAGTIAGASVVARHIEYGGSFADENITQFDLTRPMSRFSELTFDLTVPFLRAARLPLSGRIERAGFADGTAFAARGRTALSVAGTLVAMGADYTRSERKGSVNEQFTGNISASRLVDYKWQLRATSEVEFRPQTRLRSIALTADRDLSDRYSLRLGLAKSFADSTDTRLQAGVSARLPFGAVSLSGDYSASRKHWRVGLQFNFGLAPTPGRGNYRLTPPGPASGASAELLAYRDTNGNGRFDRGEAPLPGVVANGVHGPVATNDQGRAFVTGLGDGPSGFMRIDTSRVDTVFDATPPKAVSFVPRPGLVMQVPFAVVPTSEVAVAIKLRQAEGTMVGIAAVRLNLVDANGRKEAKATEFDGLAVFEQVRPGRYTVELDPDQARQLRMRLVKPISLNVDAKGELLRLSGEISFEREAGQ